MWRWNVCLLCDNRCCCLICLSGHNWLLLYLLYSILKIIIFNYLKIILTCNSLILYSFSNSFYWHVFNHLFLYNIRNIFCFILYSLIFCDLTCNWYLNLSSYFFILCNGLFIRNIFNSRFTLYSLTSLCIYFIILEQYLNL